MTENDDIITAIRDARKAKGLSQTELSALIDVPQSHISKIENGAVDLKLSSLVQITRALDLEVKLVPRKSLPAVESIVRSTKGFPRDRTGPALSEIKKIERTLDSVGTVISSEQLSLPLENINRNLQSLKALRYDTDAFVRLRKALEPISKLSEALARPNFAEKISSEINPLAKELKKITRASDELRNLRNSLVHRFDTLEKPARPAYSIEEEDDG